LAYIKKIKVIKTKNNQSMAFLTLDDGDQDLDVTIFSSDYEHLKEDLGRDVCIFKIKKNMFKDKQTFVLVSMKKL
jgi:DNA polymerase-3 subunit alpha